ncbi:WSC domain-containing protein [Colletotrichum cuscutae]|uniref:WSC domain-containing protein n=1 Tax=Colletotrichum cuscutae TaxID=1209917 RepID=A0AAI9YA61_9PEZI|nr:WSC domain-containing protein [Colletotrichum cuscutae]
MRSFHFLPLLPFALAAPPLVDPYLEMCGISITYSAITSTLLLPPQTISLCENSSNCAIPTIGAGGGSPAAPQATATQVPGGNPPAGQPGASQAPGGNPPGGQPAASQAPGGSPPAGQPAASQAPGGNPPAGQPDASQAPGGSPPAGQPAASSGGSNGNSPGATVSSPAGSGKPSSVSASSASRSFGFKWNELCVVGFAGAVTLFLSLVV